ncbi:MAG: S8 family serine peptidase [Candidatus Limnocylindria bacterium]
MSTLPGRPLLRDLTPVLLLVLTAGVLPAPTGAAGTADEILVRFRDGTPAATREAIARAAGLTRPGDERTARRAAQRQARADVLATERFESAGRSIATLRRILEADPAVVAVATNGRYELAVDPSPTDPTDEPLYGDLWGLDNTGQTVAGTGPTAVTGIAGVDIDAREAFSLEQGRPEVVVAVVDDGIDFSHVDLADRAWTNPGESGDGRETNGIDDDGNGFVDDVNGWDFCNDDNTVHDPGEDGHGTHVAGTIAASRNGIGTVGVAPGVRLMAVKFIDNGSFCGSDAMAVAAIDYVASFGVHLINASWGGPGYNAVLEAAIGQSGALMIAAAGNDGVNIDLAGQQFYPASFSLSNVVAVAAVDQQGKRAEFSNYGRTGVDIAAPGTNILSTYPAISACPSSCYAWSAGTSMAAPHATGVAALIGSRSGAVLADPVALRTRLLETGTDLPSMATITASGRLVNAYRAVDPDPPLAAAVARHGINTGTVIGSTSVSTTMVWPAATDELSGVASYWLLRSAGGGSFGTIAAATPARSFRLAFTFGTPYRFRLRARDHAGNIGPSADGPIVQASLVQEGTSLARYGGTWTTTTTSSASGGRMRTSTRAGSSVEFRFNGRAIGIVAQKGSTRGSVKVYVDGVYVRTVSLYRSSTQSRVVIYATSWTTTSPHSVKLVTVRTSGRSRVDIDGAVILK